MFIYFYTIVQILVYLNSKIEELTFRYITIPLQQFLYLYSISLDRDTTWSESPFYYVPDT